MVMYFCEVMQLQMVIKAEHELCGPSAGAWMSLQQAGMLLLQRTVAKPTKNKICHMKCSFLNKKVTTPKSQY